MYLWIVREELGSCRFGFGCSELFWIGVVNVEHSSNWVFYGILWIGFLKKENWKFCESSIYCLGLQIALFALWTNNVHKPSKCYLIFLLTLLIIFGFIDLMEERLFDVVYFVLKSMGLMSRYWIGLCVGFANLKKLLWSHELCIYTDSLACCSYFIGII